VLHAQIFKRMALKRMFPDFLHCVRFYEPAFIISDKQSLQSVVSVFTYPLGLEANWLIRPVGKQNRLYCDSRPMN